jgi:large subunit ribosomal protein L25
MAEVLNVEIRDLRGKRRARRLRHGGHIPAVLYGHGEANLSLSIPAAEVSSAIRHGSRVVDLQGAVKDKAFIREVQWDVFGLNVLHLDLTRISEHERVKVQVPVELRGEAPGVREGGVVELHVHDLQVECPVSAIPEKLQININALQKGQSLTVADIKAPEGVNIVNDPETVVVHCEEPAAEEELLAPTEAAEPEVIGRKAAEEEEE